MDSRSEEAHIKCGFTIGEDIEIVIEPLITISQLQVNNIVFLTSPLDGHLLHSRHERQRAPARVAYISTIGSAKIRQFAPHAIVFQV